MSSFWLDWYEIRSVTRGRDVYFYGRSEDWVHKAIKSYKGNVKAIVDREKSYHGTTYLNLPIVPLESVPQTHNPYFIITAGDFDGIVDGLRDKGYVAGDDFTCSPDFRDYRVLEDIRNVKTQLLVSSSDYNDQTRARSSKLGGGLYLLDTESNDFKLKLKGSFRQIEKISETVWAAVEYVEKRLVFFDINFTVIKEYPLDFPNYCGIACDRETETCWVLNAGRDEIITVAGDTLRETSRRDFSARSLGASHHINDATFFDGHLYVSYFSLSGGFKLDVFDGGVAQLDPYTSSPPMPVLSGLWKPHTPKFFDNKLYVLDSMRGSLVSGKQERLPKFPGFVRGMDKHENFLFIGQSADMYVTDRMQAETVMLNAGVYICDMRYNANRFINFEGAMNIHDIIIWGDV